MFLEHYPYQGPDLTLNEAHEVGRIMARDGVSHQEAVDRYFGPLEASPPAEMLPDGTIREIERYKGYWEEDSGTHV